MRMTDRAKALLAEEMRCDVNDLPTGSFDRGPTVEAALRAIDKALVESVNTEPSVETLALLMLNKLHEHLPEDQRPMSMSDLSDEQAMRAKAAILTVLLNAPSLALTAPTEAMLMDGVSALVDAGLDGSDGVGMSDARACYMAMINHNIPPPPKVEREEARHVLEIAAAHKAGWRAAMESMREAGDIQGRLLAMKPLIPSIYGPLIDQTCAALSPPPETMEGGGS